ncbi:hypothetical protein [Yersinia thracica]|uniref:hypothetical protein n=1 Tax=Yersinia thracica TaxID=2890319 RepID=UPI001F28A8CB|nr:hypothetical protein [Yersinia thracica]
MVSMHSIQGNLRKNGEFINNQGGALLHHNSPIPWSTFAQYLTTLGIINSLVKDGFVAARFTDENKLAAFQVCK